MPFEWDNSTECLICLEDFNPSLNNMTVIGNCFHKFHSHCIQDYIKHYKDNLEERANMLNDEERARFLNELRRNENKIPCPKCKQLFSLNSLEPFESVNIWPLNPEAPAPPLPRAPKDVNAILIYTNKREDSKGPSEMQKDDWKFGEGGMHAAHYYPYYKKNLKARCPLPHFLPHIRIPRPTDSLKVIERQFKAARRNNNIAQNDAFNAYEYKTPFFKGFLRSQGIIMTNIDELYNERMFTKLYNRATETDTIEYDIEQILINAKRAEEESKTLSGRLKSATRSLTNKTSKRLHSARRSITKRANETLQSFKKSLIERSIESIRTIKNKLRMQTPNLQGGKHKKTRKPRKHYKSRKYKKYNKSK